tara:strand:- start:5325 stop:5684 length:360 start_codon:yes stop_codon:yes gene_type:complete
MPRIATAGRSNLLTLKNGGEFGPGDHGYSHCRDHSHRRAYWTEQERKTLIRGARLDKKFLKTKYYPVNMDKRIIHDDPHERERDIAWKYRGRKPGIIGLKGSRLNEHGCYREYRIVGGP